MHQEGFSIGILALQGGFSSHSASLRLLGIPFHFVRTKEELLKSSALIIPGGESTTLSFFLKEEDLFDPILNFAKKKPVFGTCAGLILLAKLGVLSISCDRNAYGRQKDSFSASINLSFSKNPCEGIFIRAPRIKALLSPKVKVLATNQEDIVMVEEGKILGTTFHPELTSNTEIHHYFVNLCQKTLEKQ